MAAIVVHYNKVYLHSALSHRTPADWLAEVTFAKRDRELQAARALQH